MWVCRGKIIIIIILYGKIRIFFTILMIIYLFEWVSLVKNEQKIIIYNINFSHPS